MLSLITGLALASSPVSPSPADVFAPLLPQALPMQPTVLERPGARLLDVYRRGDLVVMHDADGEWLNEAYQQGANLNWILGSLYDAFYNYHQDEYEYLTILLVRDFGFFFAFYSPMANDVRGIGYDATVRSEVFDTTTEKVEGMIFMNYVGYWIDYPDAGRYVFGQEFMHRWGSFVNVSHPELDDMALLGRDDAHWSYWMHTTNSPMEGNRWVDNGDGTWTTDADGGSTYSDLDMYLMGFMAPEEVGPQTVLLVDADEQARVGKEPGSTPQVFDDGSDVTVTATPVTVTVDDIVAAEGPREPDASQSPREFHMAFLVLVLSDDAVDDTTFDQIDDVRQTFEADWEEDVLGRADLVTTLGTSTAPEWGAPAEDTGADADTGPGDSGTGADAPEDEADGCGCASSGTDARTGGVAALGLLAAAALRRRRVAPVAQR